MKKILCASLSILALSCGQSTEPITPAKDVSGATNPFGIVTVGPVDPALTKVTDKAWRVASMVRRLKPKAPVKLSILDPKALVSLVKSKVKDEVPAEVIRSEGHCFEVLGLIPKGYDYENETYALLEEELAGMYLPDDKTMYVATGVKNDELDATLSHELVHALQDQYFQIGEKMKYKPGASDALSAMQALAEGDATSAMIDEIILAKKGEDALQQMNASDMDDRTPEEFLDDSLDDKKPDAAIKKAPRFIALGLVAPYADGLAFVNGLRRRGGWDAVDMAWQKPPTSTEQLLHLEKYDAQEPSIDVPVATAAALGADWKNVYDDTFGEEEGRIAFGQWMGVAASKRAADGWGGDHVTLFESSAHDLAVGWRIVFDDDTQSKEAAQILEVAWTSTYGAPTKSSLGGVDVLVFGALVSTPKVVGEPAKKEKKAEKPGNSELPPLPDPTTTPSSAVTAPTTSSGCRAIARGGKAFALVAGAPCDKTAAFAAETAKAP